MDWLLDSWAIVGEFLKQGYSKGLSFYSCLKPGEIELLDIL